MRPQHRLIRAVTLSLRLPSAARNSIGRRIQPVELSRPFLYRGYVPGRPLRDQQPPAPPGPHYITGKSGAHYRIVAPLQEKDPEVEDEEEYEPSVFLAVSEDNTKTFVVKKLTEFLYNRTNEDVLKRLLPLNPPHIRVPEDAIPDLDVLIYPYLTTNLASLVEEYWDKDIPIEISKRILKDVLKGLAAMHENDLIYSDLNPTSILLNHTSSSSGLSVSDVKIGDIECLQHLPPFYAMRTDAELPPPGSLLWRSPEQWSRIAIQKSTDMFSFGLVAFFLLFKNPLLYIPEAEFAAHPGRDAEFLTMRAQVAHFLDDGEAMRGFLTHIAENEDHVRFMDELMQSVVNDEKCDRLPISSYENLDASLKDLLCGLTNFDPGRRLTAEEALAHDWFKGV